MELSLQDDFSRKMLQAAAATKALSGALHDLDGTAVDTSRSVDRTTASNDRLSTSAVRGSAAIDKYSGRLGLILKVASTLGPALIPIGAVAIPAVTGLANQLGFSVLAAGTAVIAFQGIGDALTAVNAAAIEPTVANLEKAHEALTLLSPAGRAFVGQLSEMRPLLTDLRDTAATALFPGLIDGLESLERLAPSVNAILTTVGETVGDLFAEGADSLASSRWSDFFAVLAINARPVLTDMAHALGDVVHGLSEMWEAFMPLNRDFGSWLADTAQSFDRWAQGLSQTQGFQNFVAYVRENGPKVAEAMGSIGNALVQIVEAAAPVGGPVLDAIANLADAIAVIADSPLGTPIAAAVTALSAMSLAANVATASVTRLNAALATTGATGAKAGVAGAASKAGPAGIVALLGALNLPDMYDNLSMVMDGERGVAEGLGRMAAAAQPTGFVLQAFGVDILGTDDKAGKLEGTLTDLADATIITRNETRRFGNTFFKTNKELLGTARQAERLSGIISDSNKEIHDAASSWFDFSQKVELGDTSLAAVIERMKKLGDAAANEAVNIQKALKRGIDPQVIQSLYDTLGPQGAVLALDQLAHASRDTVREVEKVFGGLHRGEQNVERAMRGVNEAITGSREKLRDLGNEVVRPKAELDDKGLRGGVVSAEQLLTGIDRKRPNPKADVDISGVQSGVASAERLLLGFDGRSATATITTIHRDIFQQLGNNNIGSRAPLASGGTVGGQRRPYGDKVPAILAPGEEVISNRYGQADRHRSLLKAINANRYANGGTIRSERPMSSSRWAGRSTVVVRDRFPDKVTLRVGGHEFTAYVEGVADRRADDRIDQAASFAESQR